MPENSASSMQLSQSRARQRLLNELGRRWAPGTRLPPVRDLAKLLGTGQTNMFRAVKQLVAEGVLDARPSLGTFVRADFVQVDQVQVQEPGAGQAPAIDLRGKAIHIFMKAPGDSFMAPAAQFIEQELAKAGARTMIQWVTIENEAQILAEVAGADAAVMCNPDIRNVFEKAPALVLALSTAQSIRPFRESGYDMVTVDSAHGAFLAGRHIRSTGAKRACYVGVRGAPLPGGGFEYDRLSALRLESFEQGLGARVEARERCVVAAYYAIEGAGAFEWFVGLSPRPDAVFCASDDIAVGFAQRAMERKMTPGFEFQLVGFDGQLNGRRLACGPLTTIDVPVIEMARVGLEHLLARFARPSRPVRQTLLGGELFQGTTTRVR